MPFVIASLLSIAGEDRPLVAQVPAATPAKAAAAPATNPTVVVQDYAAAMRRLIDKFRSDLATGKLLVVWVLDQSESMRDDREAIAAHIGRAYAELGLGSEGKNDTLLTGIVSYGATASNNTPGPTAHLEEIAEAFQEIPVDRADVEMQNDALQFAVGKYRKAAESENRALVVVLVSDESGDMNTNISQTEATIDLCKEARAKVYVLGREAMFGYPYVGIPQIDPATKKSRMVRVDRGPETPQPEQLQTDGFGGRSDVIPSGFGPYEQTRIARETGGLFFLLPSPELPLAGRGTDLVLDLEFMHPYASDLSSREAYIKNRDEIPLRREVFRIILEFNPYLQRQNILRTSQFPIDRTAFAQAAEKETNQADELSKRFHEARKSLEALKAERDRETDRWRANYDLLYAQTIAYPVRLREYAYYLAEFAKTPKTIKNPLGPARPTNGWDIRTVKRLLKPDESAAERESAESLFRQIQKDYPGTPWAQRAAEELKRGYGVELIESYSEPRSLPFIHF
jgi:hypothetical protein